jgi:enoyl-[acyl-carrier protein] reductase II
VRLIRTPFALRSIEAEARGASKEELLELLGRKREMLGMFEGNEEEGEFEAGQSSALIDDILPASIVLQRLLAECLSAAQRVSSLLKG